MTAFGLLHIQYFFLSLSLSPLRIHFAYPITLRRIRYALIIVWIAVSQFGFLVLVHEYADCSTHRQTSKKKRKNIEFFFLSKIVNTRTHAIMPYHMPLIEFLLVSGAYRIIQRLAVALFLISLGVGVCIFLSSCLFGVCFWFWLERFLFSFRIYATHNFRYTNSCVRVSMYSGLTFFMFLFDSSQYSNNRSVLLFFAMILVHRKKAGHGKMML